MLRYQKHQAKKQEGRYKSDKNMENVEERLRSNRTNRGSRMQIKPNYFSIPASGVAI